VGDDLEIQPFLAYQLERGIIIWCGGGGNTEDLTGGGGEKDKGQFDVDSDA
jgi:hypothetical protein